VQVKITVLGMGNAVLSDDAVGLQVAARLAADLHGEAPLPGVSVEVCCNEAGGWEILDDVEGSDALILVDSILDPNLAPGQFAWFPSKVFTSPRISGIHNTDVFSAMTFARRHGLAMPEEIHVLGIGVQDVQTYSEDCTPAVRAAVPKAARAVLQKVRDISQGG
jgi:hydrogenase maturation protease